MCKRVAETVAEVTSERDWPGTLVGVSKFQASNLLRPVRN